MQTTTITTGRQSSYTGEARVVERSRGTAHPAAITQRDRVARSLFVRPEARAERYVRR